MATGDGDRLPQKCLTTDEYGNPPTCTQLGDGSWEVSYPGGFGADTGPGGGFVALFVLVLLGGIAVTVWKVTTARRMARSSGMDERDATTMTLLTDDGFEATYLAANLRPEQQGSPPTTTPPAAPVADVASRLRELDDLRRQGLVSEEEYAATRQAILGSL